MRKLNSDHEMESNPVNDAYHREVAEFLRQVTGARDVIGQRSGLIVRTSIFAKNRTWAAPAGFVHLDYVPETARMFREISIAGEGRIIASYRRFAVYQTWRVISQPPQDNTLALCDGGSVSADDAVVFDAVVGPPANQEANFRLVCANTGRITSGSTSRICTPENYWCSKDTIQRYRTP